jgi:hypothetical protein
MIDYQYSNLVTDLRHCALLAHPVATYSILLVVLDEVCRQTLNMQSSVAALSRELYFVASDSGDFKRKQCVS